MSPIQVVLLVVAVLLVLLAAMVAFSARLSIRPGRTRPWGTPRSEIGLDYEDVEFPSQDGVRLVGWYIPPPAGVARPAPAIVTLHGWPWCRMGTQSNNPLKDFPGSLPVDLMPLARRFHEEGYGVLMFDMSGYGESGGRGVVTYGWLESRDLLGALDYLAGREDVDVERVGAIGFSAGAVALVFGASQTRRLRAGVAVQPATTAVFSRGYSRDRFKGMDALPSRISDMLYRLAGGPNLAFIQPALAAAGARDVPLLFVQGTGDRWGSVDDVARMAEMAPLGQTWFPETGHRFEGYTHVVRNPEPVLAFFAQHLGPGAAAGQASTASRTRPLAAPPPEAAAPPA